MTARTVFLFFVLASCSRQSVNGAASRELPDSVVLVRTRCFGVCPSYRLSVAKSGNVSFSNNAVDAIDSIAPKDFAALASRFEKIDFASFPKQLQLVKESCSPYATDMPSAILTIFAKEKSKTVNDYHGCIGATRSAKDMLKDLRRLEDEVDSTAHASRWINPSSRL